MSHLMDYGPDRPPAVKESLRTPRRRERIFGRDFWLNAGLLVGAFLIVATLTIISDHRPLHLNMPATHSTTTPGVASTPRSYHLGHP